MESLWEGLSDADAARLRRAERPGFRPPTLATLSDHPVSGQEWIFERKLDGVRLIASRDGDSPTLWSRNRKQVDGTYPELVDALRDNGPRRFVADGEVVAFEGAQTRFGLLQHRLGITDPVRSRQVGVPVFLYLFDLLVLDDVDLTGLPLRVRKQLLGAVFDFTDPLRLATHRSGNGPKYLAEACQEGWEGLIAKRADAPYRPGRTRDWLKLKCVHEQEFVIGGFTEPSGSRTGFGALLVGYYAGGELRYAGRVGTGYNQRTLTALRARLDDLGRKTSPFADQLPGKGLHWVEPQLVAQVGFGEWTSDGLLRHPRFLGLRDDKDPTDVVRETPR